MLTFAWILWWVLTILLGILIIGILICLIYSIYKTVRSHAPRFILKFTEAFFSGLISLSLDIACYVFINILIFGGYLS
jgi:hypothetical protein